MGADVLLMAEKPISKSRTKHWWLAAVDFGDFPNQSGLPHLLRREGTSGGQATGAIGTCRSLKLRAFDTVTFHLYDLTPSENCFGRVRSQLFENNKRLIIEIAKRNGNPVLVVERNHRGAGIVEPFPRTSRLLKLKC